MFSTMFELSHMPFKAASSRCFTNAEAYRFGSKEHITFDRFHLVNSVKCAFILYSAIFKITLMASQKDVVALVTWVLPKLVVTLLKFCAKMRDWHSVEQKRAAGRLAARLLSRNLLERRGHVCFETSLQMTSASIAAVQYLVFLSVLRLNGLFYTPPDADDWAGNVYVFPYLRDSLEAAAFKQQATAAAGERPSLPAGALLRPQRSLILSMAALGILPPLALTSLYSTQVPNILSKSTGKGTP